MHASEIAPAHFLLVTAPDCHFCHSAIDILAKLSRDFPLDVEEIDLESERGQDLAARHGIMFPPGILLDDGYVGFGRPSERKLRRLLEARSRSAAAPAMSMP
jgi:thiol-disulfide isomerase/thioredoxin